MKPGLPSAVRILPWVPGEGRLAQVVALLVLVLSGRRPMPCTVFPRHLFTAVPEDHLRLWQLAATFWLLPGKSRVSLGSMPPFGNGRQRPENWDSQARRVV